MKKRWPSVLFCLALAALVAVLCVYTYLGVRPTYVDRPEPFFSYVITGATVLLVVAVISFILFAVRRFCVRR